MDLINVENGEGYLNLSGSQRIEISQVSPQNIADALDLILQNGDISIGVEDDAERINNSAAKIIYRQLRTSLQEVIDSRETILEEIDGAFAEAEAKYLGVTPSATTSEMLA